ncbi:MAG: hypothetical protein ACIALR_14825, partial [Blastopirellula sp. JB062]
TVNETTTGNKSSPNRNPHAGLYKPYKSAYLNNADIRDGDGKAIAGQSDTLWYLFADPQILAAFVMAVLNGRNLPYIESDETDFTTLGMQWRGYDDFGFGEEAPEGAVKVAGA